MENFVKRLIVEHKELIEKRNRLSGFVNSKDSNKVSKRELLLLGAQFFTMNTYIDILKNRLIEHDIETKDGLYKKIITEADVIEDVEFDDQPAHGSDYDIDKAKTDLDDIKYE